MKKFFIITVLLLFIGCVSPSKYEVSTDELKISTGNKAGIIVLDNEDILYFKNSYVFIDRQGIVVVNEDIRQEIQWRKIRTIHIYNTPLQEDYTTELKKIQKLIK